MKIQTILTEKLIDTTKQEKNYSGTFKDAPPRGTPKKQIDAGSMASVKNDPNDPHMVIKHNRVPNMARNDLYPKFITYLIDHDIENPHFPRVYDIKKITDKEGKFIYTYRLEKLLPLSDASNDECDMFIENNFYQNSEYYEFYHFDVDKNHRYAWVAKIFAAFIKNDDFSDHLRSESLIEAMKIIKDIMHTLGSRESDIYYKNLMWRRGPHGLTLVFIDPV